MSETQVTIHQCDMCMTKFDPEDESSLQYARRHYNQKANVTTKQVIEVCSRECADKFDALPLSEQMVIGTYFDVDNEETDDLKDFIQTWRELLEKHVA